MAISLKVEMEFSGFGNGWSDVTTDVRTDVQTKLRYGIQGSGVTDRVAPTGVFQFDLDNSARNSGHLQGYYSPNSSNLRPGFTLGIRVRFSVTTVTAGTFYKFLGTLDSITPDPGRYLKQRTHCVAVDFMDDAARYLLTGLSIQTNKRSDQIFSSILSGMVRQPGATEIDTGLDTYPYALDNVQDEKTKALTEFQKLAMSELGYIYIKGDVTQGGTLVFESRARRPTASSNLDTFTDSTIVGLSASRSRDYSINKVQITTHPRRLGTSTDVLYSLQGTLLVRGGTNTTLLSPYRDANTLGVKIAAARVGGSNMINPVATTDYTMNSASDGSGSNLTANFSVTAAFGGNGVRLTVTENVGVDAYVTKLQVRGQGIYDTETSIAEFSDATSITNYGQNAVNVDMPYQSDPNVGIDASGYLVNLYKDPLTQIQSVSLYALISDDSFYTRVISREISDRVGIQETVTGLTSTRGYFINGVDYTFDERNNLFAMWTLAPSDSTQYWILEQAGASELDTTTRLGYGLIVGHTDTAHVDTHGDVGHTDVAHVDVAHSDSAHQDIAAVSGHGDSAHADTAHSDVAHVDSHGDQAAVSSHTDAAHNDSASHNDVAHADSAHSDATHGDSHTDISQPSFHGDAHGDVGHIDVPHQDTAHGDDSVHGDDAHQDSHVDSAHADTHNDIAHTDTAHSDTAHSDVGHIDTPHTDVAHGDSVHSDTHGDSAHTDTHGDTAHGDH